MSAFSIKIIIQAISKISLIILIVILIYVWFMSTLWFHYSPHHLIELLLDLICLTMVIFGIFEKKRSRKILWVGIFFATLNVIVRCHEYISIGHMFWFEPILRSGSYLLAFFLIFILDGQSKKSEKVPKIKRSRLR